LIHTNITSHINTLTRSARRPPPPPPTSRTHAAHADDRCA